MPRVCSLVLGSSRGAAVDLGEEQARGDEDSAGPVLQVRGLDSWAALSASAF